MCITILNQNNSENCRVLETASFRRYANTHPTLRQVLADTSLSCYAATWMSAGTTISIFVLLVGWLTASMSLGWPCSRTMDLFKPSDSWACCLRQYPLTKVETHTMWGYPSYKSTNLLLRASNDKVILTYAFTKREIFIIQSKSRIISSVYNWGN